MKLLLALGNEMKTDDGIGIALLEQVRDRLPGWTCLTLVQPGPELFCHWATATTVWVIDALDAGWEPGQAGQMDLLQGVEAARFASQAHGFGLAEALALARALGQLPPVLRLFGVQGQSFATGWGLSRQIQGLLPQLASDLLLAIQTHEPPTPRQ